MVDTYADESGFRPENESDIMLRLRVLAGEIYRERAYAEYIMRQMFPSTATGEYLDAHAQQRGISRKNGTKAVGSVTFSAASEEHEAVTIPAGTQVSTRDGLLRFVTNSDVVLEANALSVNANVTAAQIGSAYNIVAGAVGLIVTPVLGVAGVTNGSRFRSGSDDENDDLLRERVLDSYRNVSNGANAAYYRSVAMSVDGVYDAYVVGCARGVGTVDVYVCGKAVSLNAAKLLEISNLLSEKCEVNVDVRAVNSFAQNINLYICLRVAEGYDFNTVADRVQSAVEEYIDSLGIGKNFWLSNVGEVIYHIEGVAGYKFLESYGSDREIPYNRFAKAGTILVRDE